MDQTYPFRSETPGDTRLPEPYCYRIDRPVLHRPEGEFMMSYGTWGQAPGPLTTVEHAATYQAAMTRIGHTYYGPMAVRVWAHRGNDEHYRNAPPADAYCLVLGDQSESIPQATKDLVDLVNANLKDKDKDK